jgi:hypothetical protein
MVQVILYLYFEWLGLGRGLSSIFSMEIGRNNGRRSWKGYTFDILNKLTNEDFIRRSIRSFFFK